VLPVSISVLAPILSWDLERRECGRTAYRQSSQRWDAVSPSADGLEPRLPSLFGAKEPVNPCTTKLQPKFNDDVTTFPQPVIALLMVSRNSPMMTNARNTDKAQVNDAGQRRLQIAEQEDLDDNGVQYLSGPRFYLFLLAYVVVFVSSIMY
jgi:hypothetical protein